MEYTRFLVPDAYVITEELIASDWKFLRENLAYGIFDDKGKLRSTANALIRLPYIWVISSVETDPQYRRRGYATSVIPALIRETFQHADVAMLYVSRDNFDANRVYERLGFRKFADFLELTDYVDI